MTRHFVPFCLVGFLLMAGPVGADAASKRISAVIARALSYDRSLAQSAGRSVGVLVLYDSSAQKSALDASLLAEGFVALGSMTVHGVPIEVRAETFGAGVLPRAAKEGFDAVVVCEGLEARLAEITQGARQYGLRTIGRSLEHARGGTAMAVFEAGGRPTIAVNQTGAAGLRSRAG